MTVKHHLWHVYHSGTLVATWGDVPAPAYHVGVDGPDALTVTLPPLGLPGQDATTRGLDWHNEVQVYAVSGETLRTPPQVALWGTALWGQARWGTVAGLAVLVYRGEIEDWTEIDDTGEIEVAIAPLAARADVVILPDDLTVSGCPVQVARVLVETYGDALTWDSANPSTCGQSVPPLEGLALGQKTLREALGTLRETLGVDWFLYVTPQGTVRLLQPDTTTADHELTAGVTATGVRVGTLGRNRRTDLSLIWEGGRLDLAGQNPTDHATASLVTLDAATGEGDARRYGASWLAEHNRLETLVTLTTLPPFDPDGLALGQTVRLYRPSRTAASATALWGVALWGVARWPGGADDPLVLQGYTYGSETAELELGRPRPDLTRPIAESIRSLRALSARTLTTEADHEARIAALE